MEVKEFIRKIETKEAKVLTVERAKELNGKRIYYFYFPYPGNFKEVHEMVVGNIVTEIEYYSNQPCDGYTSRVEYWKSYMTKEQINEKYNTLLLLDSKGEDKFIRAHLTFSYFEEPTFTCSDADREVYYIESDL